MSDQGDAMSPELMAAILAMIAALPSAPPCPGAVIVMMKIAPLASGERLVHDVRINFFAKPEDVVEATIQ